MNIWCRIAQLFQDILRKIQWKRLALLLLVSALIHIWLFPFWVKYEIPNEQREFVVSLPEINKNFTKDFLIDFLGISLTLPRYNLCLKNQSYVEIDGYKAEGEELRKLMPEGLSVNIVDKESGRERILLAKPGKTNCKMLFPENKIIRGDFSAHVVIPIDLRRNSPSSGSLNFNNSPLFVRNNYIALFIKFLAIFLIIGMFWTAFLDLVRYIIKP